MAEYEYSLDYLIIDVLYDGTQSYRQLKRNLEYFSKTGKKISSGTYHRHTRKLLNNGLLKEKKIGNRVFLSLDETYKDKLTHHFPEKRCIL